MAKKAAAKPEHHEPEPESLHDILRKLRHDVRHLHHEQERLAMTAADLQTAVDQLKTAVTKIQEQIAALKTRADLITQEQLDANAADVTTAATTLQGL